MKKTISGPAAFFLLAMVIMAMASACKKVIPDLQNGLSNGSYYIKFKANGTEKMYKCNTEAQFNIPNIGTACSDLAGATKTELEINQDNLSVILITKQQTLLSRNYASSITDSASVQILAISYIDENGVSYVAPIQTIPSYLPASTVYDNFFTFTEVSASYVKGSFSGTVYNMDYSKKVFIAEGTFYLNRSY